MKEEILSKFSGRYCSIDDIVGFIEGLNKEASRKTIIWNINDLVRQGKAARFGRGVYGFTNKARFNPILSEKTKQACTLLHAKFKYLVITLTDSSILGEFMSLQPFSTIAVIETRKSATKAILSALRNGGLEAYAKSDFPKLEQYVSSSHPFVIRPELTVNPNLPQENNIRIANLEKLLVDLVCDESIYGQYQGDELQNIYQNATDRYAINYSQMIKYAAARNKKDPVVDILSSTVDFNEVKDLI